MAAFSLCAGPAPAQSTDSLAIHDAALTVSLDPRFPRVLNYQTNGGRRIPGALQSERPTIRLNGQTYAGGDFEVYSHSTAAAATYEMDIGSIGLQLGWRFEVQGQELHFELVEVRERGDFRLRTLEFPDHYLVRVPAASGRGRAYRGEYTALPWKESYPGESSGKYVASSGPVNFPGLRSNSSAHFMKIADETAESFPRDANWASADLPGVTATIADNIPYWKLETQLLGGEGAATGFAIWLGRYNYRIENEVQPLLRAQIAILDEDRNGDGEVNWMEAALWHHDRLRTPSNKFDPLTLTYTVITDWAKPLEEPPGGYAPPVTTFAQTLAIIRTVSRVTGNAKQYVVLVGWQFAGHDTGYPALNQVNERAGGLSGLHELIANARRYNATIVYHINVNDAYQRSPLFDRSVLQVNRDGEPYVWSFQFKGAPPDYRISNTKQFLSGYFQKRVQAMLDLVPVKDVIQLDTFRNSDISFGPGEDIGIVAESTYGAKILDWFRKRGIAASIEGADDAYFGTVERALHRNIEDPFLLLMMHGKIYGGGHYPAAELGQVLGWSVDTSYSLREQAVIGTTLKAVSGDQIADDYYLGNVTQSYLTRKNLIWVGVEKDGGQRLKKETPSSIAPVIDSIARFDDGTVSRMTHDGYWTVLDQGVLTVDGQRRMLPMTDRELVLYSVESGVRQWELPPGWKGAKISVRQIGSKLSSGTGILVGPDARVSLSTLGRKAYLLERTL